MMSSRWKRNAILTAILGLLLGGVAFFQINASATASDPVHAAAPQVPHLAQNPENQAPDHDADPGKPKRPALAEKETSAIIRAALEVRAGEISMVTLPASAAELEQIPDFEVPELNIPPEMPLRLRKVSKEAATPALEKLVNRDGRLKAKLGESAMDDYRADDFRVTVMESPPSQPDEQEVTLVVRSPDLTFTGTMKVKKGTLLLLDRSSAGKDSILISMGSD